MQTTLNGEIGVFLWFYHARSEYVCCRVPLGAKWGDISLLNRIRLRLLLFRMTHEGFSEFGPRGIKGVFLGGCELKVLLSPTPVGRSVSSHVDVRTFMGR